MEAFSARNAYSDAAEFAPLVGYYEALITDYLAAQAADTLEEALARFIAPFDAAVVECADAEWALETIEALLWAAWGAVVSAAVEARADDSPARLVNLVTRIRSLRAPGRADEPRDWAVWGLRVFSDLPVFGAQMREEWNLTQDESADPQSWVNLNAFAARLTAAGVDFCLYALWTLRGCLEDDERADPSGLAAVARWFEFCGPRLASLAAGGFAPPEWGAAARVGPLCANQGITGGGFSAERWRFWRARLEEHAKQPEPAARAALAAFTRAEL